MTEKNELIHKKVVQHNDLVTSVAKMDRVPLKFFELAVSALDTENPPKDRSVSLKKETLYSFFGNTGANKHIKLKKTLNSLQKAVIFYMERELEDKSIDSQLITAISKTNWNSVKSEVSITFTEEIMPYLVELKRNFTQYVITDISELNSKYSIIIYKLLSMNFGQYEYYKDKGTRTTAQLEEWKNPEISLIELRKVTDTLNTYKYLSNFEKRVLKLAVDEINENTNLEVEYEKIRHGKSIGAIQFFVTRKGSTNNEFYKEEQKDPTYLEGKKKKEIEFEENFELAQRNVYTRLLLDLRIIDFDDMFNKDLMVELGHTVYPMYDKLENVVGREGLVKHLNHVNKHKEEYSFQNKPKYLRKAIRGYLEKEIGIEID